MGDRDLMLLVNRALLAGSLALGLVGSVAAPAAAAPNETTLVSRADGVAGAKQDGSLSAVLPAISGDGRYVAFQSNAPNLGTTTGIYLRDTLNHTTALVSRANNGDPANAPSDNPAISADGRYVAFDSTATNLPGDTSGDADIFVRDMVAGTTTLVSRANNGDAADATAANPSISGDGQRIAFESDATNLDAAADGTDRQIFVRDLTAETTALASRGAGVAGNVGDGASSSGSISADGSAVSFESEAANLDPVDTDSTSDVFVRDLGGSSTSLVSRADGAAGAAANADSHAPAIAADGTRIAFSSGASNLVGIDSDSTGDVYVRDLVTGETTLISVTTTPGPGNGLFDGRPSISADGRIVAFESFSTNLNPGDADGFIDIAVYDTQTAQMLLASRADGAAGAKGDHSSRRPALSADGLKVAFTSEAANLDADDTSVDEDVYTRELDIDITPPTVSIESAPSGRTADDTPTIEFNSMDDDILSYECFVDGVGSTCGGSETHTTAALSDGPHTFGVQATDEAGNVGDEVGGSFTVDTTGPVTSITSAPPATTPDKTPTIFFSSNAADLASFQCALDAAAFATCASPVTTAALADGAHTFKVRALDDLSNVGGTRQASFTVDTAPPPDTEVSDPSASLAKKLTVSGKELAAEIGAGAGEDVDVDVTGAVLVKPKQGKSKTTALAPASGSSAAEAQENLTLRYKGSKKKRRKLTKKLIKSLADGARATLSAEVVLSDDAGNSVTLERSAKLKAKK